MIPRFIRTVEAPSQSLVRWLTAGTRTELLPGEEVVLVHWGEDGPCHELVQTRSMFIGDPMEQVFELSAEFMDELIAQEWAEEQAEQDAFLASVYDEIDERMARESNHG